MFKIFSAFSVHALALPFYKSQDSYVAWTESVVKNCFRRVL